jgi:hypothetical protein
VKDIAQKANGIVSVSREVSEPAPRPVFRYESADIRA